MFAAIAASALVHAGLLALPSLDAGTRATRLYAGLDAQLVVQMATAAPASVVAAAAPIALAPTTPMVTPREDAPIVRPADALTSARVQPAVVDIAKTQPVNVAPAASPAPTEIAGDVRVRGEEVVSLSRLGDLLERQLRDYPREVQAPVRVYRPLEAVYPPEARAVGIEGTVLAWVVVDPTATVEEIQIVDGDPIFHDAVISAIRNGVFQPAFDAGEGLHYPIALEFRFALDNAERTAVVKAAVTDAGTSAR
jgi:TonB family protein